MATGPTPGNAPFSGFHPGGDLVSGGFSLPALSLVLREYKAHPEGRGSGEFPENDLSLNLSLNLSAPCRASNIPQQAAANPPDTRRSEVNLFGLNTRTKTISDSDRVWPRENRRRGGGGRGGEEEGRSEEEERGGREEEEVKIEEEKEEEEEVEEVKMEEEEEEEEEGCYGSGYQAFGHLRVLYLHPEGSSQSNEDMGIYKDPCPGARHIKQPENITITAVNTLHITSEQLGELTKLKAELWGIKMKVEIFLLLATAVARSTQLTLGECGTNARRPEITDITVQCGTSSIDLAVQMCPVIYTGYNESLLILNHMLDPACRGTLDDTVDPPVARFSFALNMTNACSSLFVTTSAPGTGIFSNFSNIQTVNVSGVIRSSDPTTGTVTYNAELKYYYSCAYPLEYLINNTQVDVSASSISVKDNNGSFISTLTMDLFSDVNYTRPMIMPKLGLELRSTVYVEVKATNLTGQYNVLLDRCYASISPLPSNSSYFNLFVSCSQDQLTTMVSNGMSQYSRFHFPAFRFIEQQNETVSTYYLHCITRLCEISSCSSFMQCSNKRRRRDARYAREAQDTPAASTSSTTVITDVNTITSPEIITRTETVQSKEEVLVLEETSDDMAAGLAAAVGVLAFACVAALCVAVVLYNRMKR
ncbi:hypothetical protein CRUP_002691 [Coryphaenoides rupestris]|nr:hypothetical protein CRUP_002691 [Coryphaenoides rupestris]